MIICPCWSGKQYVECCQPFHEGLSLPPTALELMRSRYAAYALALADYLMDTTHPKNPQRKENRAQWKEEILTHCWSTQFQGLEIVEFKEIDDLFATVTFIAHLQKQGKDISFMEKSLFRKEEGKWLYLQAQQLRPWP